MMIAPPDLPLPQRLLASPIASIKGIVVLLALAMTPMALAQSIDNPADRATFEHMDTGFALRGAHEHLTCEQCHVRGIFKGTPRRCVGCHQYSTDIEASKKPPNHIPTTQDCDVCHDHTRPNVSWQLVRMNHAGLVGDCARCHNNVFVAGKIPNHIRTRPNQPCEDCHHSTVSWANARFDHAGITTGCIQCHNNIAAQGKPPLHIPLSATVSCEICHGTRFTSFANVRMDHAGANISSGCQDCHQAEKYLGVFHVRPAPPHPASPPDCAICHCTRTFDRQICRR